RLGRDKLFLAGLELEHVALLDVEVPAIGGRPVRGRVRFDVALVGGRETVVLQSEPVPAVGALPHGVDADDRDWSYAPAHTVGVGALPRLQDAPGGQHRRVGSATGPREGP